MDAAFDVFICSVVAPVAADEYPVAGPCPLQGMVDLAFEDKEAIRTAFCLLSTLVATFHRIAKDCNAPAFARFLEDTRSVFAMLAPASLGSVAWPSPGQLFVLTPYASVSHEDWLIFLNSDDTRRCEIDWGPSPQSVRDLLAPAAACLYTWMGNAFAPPILDLLYCFTASPTSFVSCWTPCPADASFLDKPAVVKRVTQLRTRGDLDSPAHALVEVSQRVATIVQPLLQSLFTASSHLPASRSTYFDDLVTRLSVADLVEAVPQQLLGITRVAQVLSPLPQASSLPSYTPNYADDTHSQWFKAADYFFAKLVFPLLDIVRGDASAERLWHQYVSDVLHNRIECMHLSESQVIRHLSKTFSRADRHFQTAKEKAQTPFCSVRDWLNAIRDFYFTNGQFRMHVESAWKSYRAGQAADFNDLVHHIRAYYQLIFLDYPDLPSKMNKHDFARHLFDKVHFLMSPECNSALGVTLRMFLALPDLLYKLRVHIEPAMTWTDARSSSEAELFISWCVNQIQAAKDSANSAKRYATATANQFHGVDFASDSPTAQSRARLSTGFRRMPTRSHVTMAYQQYDSQPHGKYASARHKHPRIVQQMTPQPSFPPPSSAKTGPVTKPRPPHPF